MKRFSGVSKSVLCLAAIASGALGFEPRPVQADDAKASAAPAAESVTIVFLGNSACPMSGKPVDREHSVEVDGQRVYTCCGKCEAALGKDAEAAKDALAKAYAVATPVAAKKCCCGEEIDADKAVAVTFQGHKVQLCCADCEKEFKKHPVTSIALLLHPDATDVKNSADPIDDKPVDGAIVALYKTHLVHFASWANAEKFKADPDEVVAKLKLTD